MSKEAKETTEAATITNGQAGNTNEAAASAAASNGLDITAEPNKFLARVFNPEGRKLDASAEATANKHTEEIKTAEIKTAEDKTKSAAETETSAKKQETKAGDNLILRLETGEGEEEFDLNNEEHLKKLIDNSEEGKLKLNLEGKETEFDLTTEEGLAEFKQAVQDSQTAEDTKAEDKKTGANVLELKIGDNIEKFDLAKPEELEKVKQFAQKGRYFEQERQQQIKDKEAIEAEKQHLEMFSTGVGHAILFNITQGKFKDESMLRNKSSEYFRDMVEDDPKYADLSYTEKNDIAEKLWNDDNDRKAGLKQNIKDFETNYKKTAVQFSNMIKTFQEKHPEFKDAKGVMDWIGENVAPYSAPILTYGAQPYEEDLLEMVYFWKNKDALLAHAKNEGAKKYAKAKIIKRSETSSITESKTPASLAADRMQTALKAKNITIAH